MSIFTQRIPGLPALNNAVERVFPTADEHAETYHVVAGVFVAIGGIAVERTVDWAEKAASSTSKIELIGTIAVAAMPAGTASFFWRRGWKSQGE